MFATLSAMVVAVSMTLPSASVFGAEYSQELQDAYNWAYSKGVTTMSPIDNANMYGAITRAEMAKMLSVYSTEVLKATPDTSAACTFSDIDSVKGDLHDYIIESCQLGIMGQGITAFRPYDTISRAEFGTALSRVLWGSTYEGGTPYYAKHLDALKTNAIMNQIANAESTKEIRGYVMLMLMRSETNAVDCDDPVVALACLDEEAEAYKECPAACREDASKEGGEKVAKGDLEVTADAAPNKKILASGTSDLDTITFKTSEKVDINKITLERYGYSDADQVVEVRLEDQDGNVIADAKGLTKDKVTLSLKKGYRTVDGKLEATLVVTTSGAAGTMWFKVTDVDSTAANVDLDDYNPNIYDVVDYAGKTVYVEIKGTDKDYNYEEGKSYEVARLKLKAGENAVLVKGFTLTNDGKLDMGEFLDELTVTAEGKEVKGLKYSVNKDDELVISFDEVTIDINKNATFVISASFKEFDDYGEIVKYYIAETADVNAVEKKNGTRVQLDLTAAGKADAKEHKFAGGKIKIVNKKLGNVDAAQGSEDIVIAEWDITVTEGINKLTFDLTAANTGIESLKFVINDDEYEGKRSESGANVTFSFKNVEIEKSGKAQFLVSIYDKEEVGGSFTFSAFNKNAFTGAKYADANEPVQTADVAGSISFSKVTIQASRWSLENNITKDVEFLINDTSRKVVFDGTYTAKKGDVNLNSFYIDWTKPANNGENVVTFYVFVDGEEVGDTDALGSWNKENFSDVLVAAGKSVKVKVEAEVEAYASWVNYEGYTLVIAWEDKNGNDAGEAYDELVKFKTKESGTTKVESTESTEKTLLKKAEKTVATFRVKPSNADDEDLTLDEFTVKFTPNTIKSGDIRVKVDGEPFDATSVDDDNITFEPFTNIPKEGIVVEIKLAKERTGDVSMDLVTVNTKPQTRTFTKTFATVVAKIVKQEQNTDNTKYTVELSDSSYDVSDFTVYYTDKDGKTASGGIAWIVSDGKTFQIYGDNVASHVITEISYTIDVDGTPESVDVLRDNLPDFFKIGSEDLRVYKIKD